MSTSPSPSAWSSVSCPTSLTCPSFPARGAIADIPGRSLAVVAHLGFDLQPAGWRLTDATRIDHRRARSLLAQDLDALEELTQGYVGTLKVQLGGPWTLAATVEKPRGDKVLADPGPAGNWPRRSRRESAPTSRTCAVGCPARTWSCRSTSRRCPCHVRAGRRPRRGSTGTAR